MRNKTAPTSSAARANSSPNRDDLHPEQLSLDLSGDIGVPSLSLDQFPNNYAGNTAGTRIEADLHDAQDQLLVTGFTSLEKIIGYLASFYGSDINLRSLRVLLGHEPLGSNVTWRTSAAKFSQEITDYWLDQGVSVSDCARVIAAIEVLKRGKDTSAIQVRTSDDRVIHAKIYRGDDAITTGSSNFSYSGLVRQIESNVRFTREEHPDWWQGATDYAEWVWQQGRDYLDDLLELLEQLLSVVTWQEALARACAEVLEGDWAKEYILPTEAHETVPLWPTQRQGIAQALWIMENLGSVLVADATGSGKTRMGAHLLKAVVDRMWQTGRKREGLPVLTCPGSIEQSWTEEFNRCLLGVDIYTHGILSSKTSRKVDLMNRALKHAQVFAVDEAHNFLDRASQRTRTLYSNMADYVVLFTATPINKGVRDLLAMVDLLGADNFDDETLVLLDVMLKRRGNRDNMMTSDEQQRLRHAIERFMVRRTMPMLNRAIGLDPDSYHDARGQRCRYPDQNARIYECPGTPEDLTIVEGIRQEAEKLRGLIFLGKRVTPFRHQRGEWHSKRSPEDELELRLRMAHSLAIYQVISCLRSSRAALIEHVYGTNQAKEDFSISGAIKATESGDQVGTLRKMSGQSPDNGFSIPLPSWLASVEEYARACAEEAAVYERIAELTLQMSDARENIKAHLLVDLLEQHGKIVAFDWHLITLHDLERRIRQRGAHEVLVATGTDDSMRTRVRDLFDSDRTARDQSAIALCSEAMSEAIGLQRASAIVHLDMPSTIRKAEQRTGRVARMNSPHDTIDVLWPRETGPFSLRLDERLVERHRTVATLIGANLELPAELTEELYATDQLESIAQENQPERWDDLRDAFAPVRSLLERELPLVPPDVYERLRKSTARVVSSVSVVQAEIPWAFFAIAGTEWGAPRWVYLDEDRVDPVIDLESVEIALRRRLGPSIVDRPLDEKAAAVLTAFVTRLKASEHLLLPKKKQRALEQMAKVLKRYATQAAKVGDEDRMRLAHELAGLVNRQFEDQAVDLRALADCWLSVISPYWIACLTRAGRSRPLRLRDIDADLLNKDTQIPTDTLRSAFEHTSLFVKPLDRRIVAAIVGVV
jgi:SNF2-related domain/Helicase conserved C-terminal domain